MSGALASLRAAFTYFSTLPAGGGTLGSAPDAGALEALPLVGLVTGALAGVAGLGLSRLLPRSLVPPLVLAARLGLTGAVHLDGYLDACDALFASASPARRLEILKDPRHGTYALAGFAVWLPLELACVTAIPPRRWPVVFAATSVLARAAALASARTAPYARTDPTPAFARLPRVWPLLAAGLGGAALAARAFRGGALVLPCVALPASRLLVGFARRQLGGGLTGDAYGFTIVVLESAMLACTAAATARR